MFALISCLIGEAGEGAYREGLWGSRGPRRYCDDAARKSACGWRLVFLVEIKGRHRKQPAPVDRAVGSNGQQKRPLV